MTALARARATMWAYFGLVQAAVLLSGIALTVAAVIGGAWDGLALAALVTLLAGIALCGVDEGGQR